MVPCVRHPQKGRSYLRQYCGWGLDQGLVGVLNNHIRATDIGKPKSALPSRSPLLLSISILGSVLLGIQGTCFVRVSAADPPYPPSDVITGLSIDFSTHRRRARGSDNWATTWAADDHQYTTWGDGGGFGGTSSNGRVSLGVGRIEGEASSYIGKNIWGGLNARVSAQFTGKSYGILAIGNDLYLWRCGAGSGPKSAFSFQRLYISTDYARSWDAAAWEFPATTDFYCPTFLQAGQGYTDAPDDFVYMYAAEHIGDTWSTTIVLFRAPTHRLMEREAYEFFTGWDVNGTPQWSAHIDERRPVFEDPNGVHLVSVSYNAALERYLLTTVHSEPFSSTLAIFDAPAPWGPWTTVHYAAEAFGAGSIEPTTFFFNFAPKWWANGGKDFTLIFTGIDSNDSWNTVQGSLTVSTSP
jgi:hypothetical protein